MELDNIVTSGGIEDPVQLEQATAIVSLLVNTMSAEDDEVSTQPSYCMWFLT